MCVLLALGWLTWVPILEVQGVDGGVEVRMKLDKPRGHGIEGEGGVDPGKADGGPRTLLANDLTS